MRPTDGAAPFPRRTAADARPRVAADPLIGATLDGYEVRARLGRGGMGEVYRAFDARLGRAAAVKIVSAARAADPSFLARFDREMRAASTLSHPNVARVYAAGLVGSRPYYVMEFVEGRTLSRVLDEEGPLAPSRALDYVRQACEGLSAAHAGGIVHRDVKPDNLMVDAAGLLKVVDFGLARPIAAGATITLADRVMGTPQYMAPEQATSGSADHRSDIYALGATFYHLLAGAPPFTADAAVAVLLKHVNEPLVPLDRRVPGVGPVLASVVGRMLAKEPAERYQDYGELAAALEEVRNEIDRGGPAGAPWPEPVEEPPRERPAPPLPAWVLLVAAAAVAAAAALTMITRPPVRPPGRRRTPPRALVAAAAGVRQGPRSFDGACGPL